MFIKLTNHYDFALQALDMLLRFAPLYPKDEWVGKVGWGNTIRMWAGF
jgi:hypothetical protein